MAVFFNTGGGDIYAGPTKQAVLAAIRDDLGDEDFKEIEGEIYEVPGRLLLTITDENDEPTGQKITIAEEYGDDLQAYCIASTNY